MAEEENKKDLTSILEVSKRMADSGELPTPEGGTAEDTPIEQIDEFESLEAYSEKNPAPDPDSAMEALNNNEAPEPEAPSESSISDPIAHEENDSNLEPPESLSQSEADPFSTDAQNPLSASDEAPPTEDPFAESPNLGDELAVPPPESSPENPGELNDPFSTDSPSPDDAGTQSPSDFASPLEGLSSSDGESPASSAPSLSEEQAPQTADDLFATNDTSFSEVVSESEDEPGDAMVAPPPPAKEAPPNLPEEIETPPPQPVKKKEPLQEIRKFSEKTVSAKPAVPASYPFSIQIIGPLRPEEKERLCDRLERESLGIRQIDLEPQFEEGKILIPRVSEYAAVVIVQALRGCLAEIRVGPSDLIYSTQDTKEDSDFESEEAQIAAWVPSNTPPEKLPVTTDDHLPDTPSDHFHLVDTVSASASLESTAVEAETTGEFQLVLDGLIRELKYKAQRRGADAILQLKTKLSMLSSPTHYRVIATGVAVKRKRFTSLTASSSQHRSSLDSSDQIDEILSQYEGPSSRTDRSQDSD